MDVFYLNHELRYLNIDHDLNLMINHYFRKTILSGDGCVILALYLYKYSNLIIKKKLLKIKNISWL